MWCGDDLKLEPTLNEKDAPELSKQLSREEVTKNIMMDAETADFSIRCMAKTSRVHKSVLCQG